MGRINLGTAALASTMAYSDSILVEIGGSIRRITLADFTDAIQSNDLGIRLYAWGVPIKQDVQSSPDWGRVGNLDLWTAYKAQIGRYLLSSDGTKMAKLNRNDSSVYADGTALDESKGNVMVYFPRLYYDLRESSYESYPTLWMSTLPISGHYIEKQIVGAYKGSYDGSKLVSRSGVTPKVSQTITQFWTAAQANGNLYGITDWNLVNFLMMLQLSEYGSPDSQGKVGNGVTGSGTVDWQTEANTLLTGATISLGDNCGNIPITSENYTIVDASRVNFFGVEDRWGWQWEMTQGIYCGSSANSAQSDTDVYIYEGNRLPSSTELTTNPTGNYRKITCIGSDYQQIKSMYLGDYFDMICTKGGGTTSTYWCDRWRWSNTGQLVLVGGRPTYGLGAGLGCVISPDAFLASGSGSGARLAYYGNPTIVNGAAM